MATQEEIAEHLDLSARQVQRLIKQGVLPVSKGSRGYDPDACRFAYINHLRARSQHDIEPDLQLEDGELERRQAEATLKLTEERARDLELKNQSKEGQLIPTTFASWVLSKKLVPGMASQLDTLPLTLKRKAPDIQQRHLSILERELAKTRNLMAEGAAKIPDWVSEYLQLTEDNL